MTKNIFKKSVFTLLLGIIITLNSLPLAALAADPAAAPAPARNEQLYNSLQQLYGDNSASNPAAAAPATPSGTTDVANPTEGQLLYQFNYGKSGDTSKTKIGAVNALPNATWQKTLSTLVTILLNISGALTLVAMTIGGVFMIVAHGNADLLGKGKKIVLYSIGGLIIIAVSYAIVVGVSELQFFTPGTPGTNGAAATPAGGAATPAATPAPASGTAPNAGGGVTP